MKKFLSNKKTAIVLVIITVLLLAAYVYMLVRPISYGMAYYSKSEFEGKTFEGTMKFNRDNTVNMVNTNYDQEMTYRYYYKNGYAFFMLAKTDEEYADEVKSINDNFEEAVKTPFYAEKINSFVLAPQGADGYEISYICTPLIVHTVVAGLVQLALIALTVSSFVLCKKKSSEE